MDWKRLGVIYRQQRQLDKTVPSRRTGSHMMTVMAGGVLLIGALAGDAPTWLVVVLVVLVFVALAVLATRAQREERAEKGWL